MLWSAVLVILNLLLWHEELERAGELIQVCRIGAAAIFVGTWVRP
ncbi:MAG: hypothetical protein ACC726_10075 [Chloroflexota bacterium]